MDSPDSRILLVEDHQDTREFLEVLLAQSKYEVKTASTFNEALELADAQSFGLFIFHSVLPDGSGVDLCRRVREFNERTPIIFYSGLAYEADIKNALGAGAQAYLVKPVDLTELIESIEKLIGKCAVCQSSENKGSTVEREAEVLVRP
jgi:two-component system, OmpR family, phosphate regulon response regulator PhoB